MDGSRLSEPLGPVLDKSDAGSVANTGFLMRCVSDPSEDTVLDPTGRRVRLAGVTVADFRGGKIRSYETYFDDLSLFAQVAVA